jgi:hypothetical protein
MIALRQTFGCLGIHLRELDWAVTETGIAGADGHALALLSGKGASGQNFSASTRNGLPVRKRSRTLSPPHLWAKRRGSTRETMTVATSAGFRTSLRWMRCSMKS